LLAGLDDEEGNKPAIPSPEHALKEHAMDDLLADFITETNENLAELDVALVKLEQMPGDIATLSLIFRLVHTIKGTCGFLGLTRLERVAHAAENVLGMLREGTLAPTAEIVSLILTTADQIKRILAGLTESGQEPAGDDQALIAALNAAAAGEKPAVTPADSAAAPQAAPAAELPAAPAESPQPQPQARTQAQEPHPVTAEAARQATPVSPPAEAAHPTEAAPSAQTIRVSVDVLEHLMTLVSELVLTRNQLLQLARKQENAAFSLPLQRLSQITSELQEGVMKSRMQPIGNAWNKLPRLVRDLSHELGKKIELTMHGAETELDRQVLELVKDPLTHMVRNSADHGLEPPEERRAAHKPETGRISLNAFHEGGHIIIEVSDDGRGLSTERIRAKALALGLATEAELAGMSESQIHRFIFRAGFSTANNVSAVSGRGVGMDVVKTNVERIGGTIDVKSVSGIGTTFTIKIPLTLAIVSALIVEAGGERFAIPQISVQELVHARTQSNGNEAEPVIERINTTLVLRLRNQLLPLVALTELLQLAPFSIEQQSHYYVIVVQVGANLFGIIVDRIFDTEEIVVKPVAAILRHLTLFSGNTILGDGSVIMILDTNGIARAVGLNAAEEKHLQSKTAFSENTVEREKTNMLLFRAGSSMIKAVPLALVARLEDIPREQIEHVSGGKVTQYRGQLMPLISMHDQESEEPTQAVLVFNERGRIMGLMVDEILDIVATELRIELTAARPGLLGTAVIAGHATDIVDISYWLTQAHQDWFSGTQAQNPEVAARLLVVEDSDFFRDLIGPMLNASGYHVTAVPTAVQALQLRDGGQMFDAIVSDIEMPEMDGFAFARAVRAGGPWREIPMIALSSRSSDADMNTAREVGFTDYVVKFDREALIESIRQCLAQPPAPALAA
jgi:two-component system chemotaxis sensor kinase CheA